MAVSGDAIPTRGYFYSKKILQHGECAGGMLLKQFISFLKD